MTTLRRWLQRPDFPKGVPQSIPKRGWTDSHAQILQRWRVGLQDDRAQQGDNQGGGVEDISPARRAMMDMLLKKARMDKIKLEIKIKEGQYVPRDLIDGALGGLAARFIEIFDEMEMSFPARFAGKTAAQIEKEFGKLLDSYRNRILEKGEYELVGISKVTEQINKRGRPKAE